LKYYELLNIDNLGDHLKFTWFIGLKVAKSTFHLK